MQKRLLVSSLSSILLLACSQQGDPARPGLGKAQLGTDAGQEIELAPVLPPQRYTPVAGLREFSGRMIVRPRQVEAVGVLDDASAKRRYANAVSTIANYKLVEHVKQTDEYIIEVPEGSDENTVARDLLDTGFFQYAEPDWILYPLVSPNDTFLAQSWQHNNMQSRQAWDLHTGNPTVSVAICDTGLRTTHEDFQLHRLEGYNAVDRQWESNGGNISAVHPHGTQCTGCAAANGNNGKGVVGIGWNLAHRMMRVSNSSGGGAAVSTLQHAARTAVENGSRVASVSYSGADTSSNLTTASYVKSQGGLVLWAAGNDNRNLSFGNRDNDDLIVVGATTEADAKASFSAFGAFVDVTAPGASVATASSTSDTAYVYASGTSFACPIAAGLCALIWSANPSLTPDQVEAILKSSCDDLGATGTDNTFGYGRVNSFKAMQQATSGNNAPSADFSASTTSGTAPLTVQFSDQSTGNPSSWSWSFGDSGSSSSQNPSHTYTTPGTYTVSMTATNSSGSDTRTRSNYITVSAQNQAPNVSAGADQTITLPATASLDGTVTDDGLPNNSVTSTWSRVSGPGTVSFGNANAVDTSASFSSAGTYVLRLTANDGQLSSSDTVTIVVNQGGGREVTIATDDFESASGSGGSGWADVWRGAGDVRLATRHGANSGRWHLRLRRSTGMAMRAVNLSGVSNAKLIYWAKLRSFEGSDQAAVLISTNGGASYSTLKTYVNGDDTNTYRRWEFSIPGGSANTIIRFDANMSGAAAAISSTSTTSRSAACVDRVAPPRQTARRRRLLSCAQRTQAPPRRAPQVP